MPNNADRLAKLEQYALAAKDNPEGRNNDLYLRALQEIKELRAAGASASTASPAATPQPQPQPQPQPINSPAPLSQPVEYDYRESLKNFPQSAMGVLEGIGTALLNPIDTAMAVGDLALSGLSNAAQAPIDYMAASIEAETGRKPAIGQFPNQEPGEQFAGMLADRYGSVDALKTTAMEDPAGLLLDVGGLVAGGAPSAARFAPMTAATRGTGTAVRSAAEKGYASALKPSTTLKPDERREVIRTGLDEGIMPTEGGLRKLETKMQSLSGEVDRLIDQAVRSGEPVKTDGLFRYIDDLKERTGPPLLEGVENEAFINKRVDQMKGSIAEYGEELTLADLQRIKQDLYRGINYDRANNRATPIKEDTDKVIASGARQTIEEGAPGVRELNQRMGNLIELRPQVERGAGRIANRDILGLGIPMKIAAGGAIDPRAAAVGAGVGLLDAPTIKAAGSIVADRLSKPLLQAGQSAGAVELGAALSGGYLLDLEEEERKKKRNR